MRKASVVIPFYNGDEYIDACLKSLSDGSFADTEKIIVNNSDRRTGIHEIAASYPNVKVIDTKPRIGFGRACNAGAKLAVLHGASYIIILNQDTIVGEDLVGRLIRPLEESRTLVITAPLHYEYNFSSIESSFIRGCISRCPELFSDALDGHVRPHYKIDFVRGTCFAVRADFIDRYGLFDPLYFMYGEDTELCRRVTQIGFDMAIIPGARIAHYHMHINASGNDKKIINLWERRSMSVLKLTDISIPFLKACIIACIDINKDYIEYLLTLKLGQLFRSILNDAMIILNLPSIIYRRVVIKKLVIIGKKEVDGFKADFASVDT